MRPTEIPAGVRWKSPGDVVHAVVTRAGESVLQPWNLLRAQIISDLTTHPHAPAARLEGSARDDGRLSECDCETSFTGMCVSKPSGPCSV